MKTTPTTAKETNMGSLNDALNVKIEEAAQEILFWIGQGNTLELATGWTLTLRSTMGPRSKAKVAKRVAELRK